MLLSGRRPSSSIMYHTWRTISMRDPNSSRKRRSSMAAIPTTRDVQFWMSRTSRKKTVSRSSSSLTSSSSSLASSSPSLEATRSPLTSSSDDTSSSELPSSMAAAKEAKEAAAAEAEFHILRGWLCCVLVWRKSELLRIKVTTHHLPKTEVFFFQLITPCKQVPPPVFFFNFFTTHIAGHQFNSRKSAPPPAANYRLRGGEYKDPITPPCGILLRLSADTLFPTIRHV